MITETSEVAFRHNLADLLNQVHFCGDSIVINKDGSRLPRWWTRACSRASDGCSAVLMN